MGASKRQCGRWSLLLAAVLSLLVLQGLYSLVLAITGTKYAVHVIALVHGTLLLILLVLRPQWVWGDGGGGPTTVLPHPRWQHWQQQIQRFPYRSGFLVLAVHLSLIVALAMMLRLLFAVDLTEVRLWGLHAHAMVLAVGVVPVVEELFFRGYLTTTLQRWSGEDLWARYASVVIFTILHTFLTFDSYRYPVGGMAVGPFFLAIACEWARVMGFFWFVPIGIHIIANASVYILGSLYPDWLEILSLWYMLVSRVMMFFM